ncbi:hypothetical protein ACQR1Y_07815 [Bradyrhizobium sp. HKCCYLRH3099]|uniref:hypothetical protein n=1 Tax=unclassified Bradyrhizobium TaxID=2631580 RepID=UPI003EBD3FFD
MRDLLNRLKYISVIVLLAVWFPVQYLFVVGVAQFVLAVVTTGFLLAVFLLLLTAVGARLGVELTSSLSRWFWVLVPALIAAPVNFYMIVRGIQHNTYYQCRTCGWDLLVVPMLNYIPNYGWERMWVGTGFVAAVYYAILIVSSLSIKFMNGRS